MSCLPPLFSTFAVQDERDLALWVQCDNARHGLASKADTKVRRGVDLQTGRSDDLIDLLLLLRG